MSTALVVIDVQKGMFRPPLRPYRGEEVLARIRDLQDRARAERIPVVSKDVLDVYPRKVCFFPASGKAMVKRLAATNTDALVAQDRAAAKAVLPAAGGGGSVDLF